MVPERARSGIVEARTRRTVVELLTDPWSVWCWGFEPVRRALELRYPSIEFRPLLGGMFERMPDAAGEGFDLRRFFGLVQSTTGMPTRVPLVRPESTYPACVQVHAVRLATPAKERPFLRAQREAAYLDGLNVSDRAVGLRIARSVGVDVGRFEDALDSGDAQRRFDEEIARLQALELRAYPTVLIHHGDRIVKAEGFQTLSGILALAEAFSEQPHPPAPDPSLEQIIPAGERVATREVAEVLGVSLERAFERLVSAQRGRRVRRQRHPGGDVWHTA